jgi:hypothetical protein
VAVLGLCLVAASVFGGDPADELKALQKKYEEGSGSYPDRFEAVKADFQDFARRNGSSEEALEARLFLLENTWWEREKGTMNSSAATLADEILRLHSNSPQLGKMVEKQYVFSSSKKREIFERLLKESPNPIVQAEALFGLAKMDQKSTDAAEQARAQDRFKELSTRYGTLKRRGLTPYAEIADAVLSPYPAAALEIGKPAPEITGFDVDGKPLKLSTYRGRVVVIDFWGDW